MFPPALGQISFALAVLFGLYLAWEAWRWTHGNPSQLEAQQFRRRLLGGFLLEAALGMWVLANPVLANHSPRAKLLYLSVSMLFTLFSMMVAVRESAFLARQYGRQRAQLLRDLRAEAEERARLRALQGKKPSGPDV